MLRIVDRRAFIGGSDARIIMGDDKAALVRLWREKRGEVEPEDLSANLIVQLGTVTEPLNRLWYERHSGHVIDHVQRRVVHPAKRWMAATLDGIVKETGAVFEAKFMLPWTFSEEGAAVKHMAQLQHNMWVANARSAVLSIITGGGKWVELLVHADPLYQHLLAHRRKEVLAGCDERGATAAVRDRAAPAPAGSGAYRRYDGFQRLGGARDDLPPDSPGPPAARGRQGRAEAAGAGGRQGGSGPWSAR
jgi:predicted phage-related endonuclease